MRCRNILFHSLYALQSLSYRTARKPRINGISQLARATLTIAWKVRPREENHHTIAIRHCHCACKQVPGLLRETMGGLNAMLPGAKLSRDREQSQQQDVAGQLGFRCLIDVEALSPSGRDGNNAQRGGNPDVNVQARPSGNSVIGFHGKSARSDRFGAPQACGPVSASSPPASALVTVACRLCFRSLA